MDEIDVQLCLHLLTNSRLTFRELGERVDLSINAVHKRVKELVDSGIIGRFSAHPSIYILNAILILVFGETEEPICKEDLRKLSENKNTQYVLSASGNNLYVGAILQSIHDLDAYVQFTKKCAGLIRPEVGIVSGNYFTYARTTYAVDQYSYDRIDWKIIRSLHKDARKSLSEVAGEIGTSVQTVRRHLDNMLENNAIQLTIDWRPDNSNDVITFLHIELKPNAKREEYIQEILNQLSTHLFLIWTFNNLPDLVVGWTWTKNMKELQELMVQLQNSNVESIVPYILYEGHTFDTWRDSLPIED
jgi:DNA-binding Lrp family transcriptional regulator